MVGICGVSSGFAELGLVTRSEGRVWVINPGLCGLRIRKDSGKRHFLISELGYRFARGCVRCSSPNVGYSNLKIIRLFVRRLILDCNAVHAYRHSTVFPWLTWSFVSRGKGKIRHRIGDDGPEGD